MAHSDVYIALSSQGVEPELAFPRDEFERRIAAARAEMENRDLDVMVLNTVASTGYLTGFDTHMSPTYVATLVPREGELVIECAEVEVATALRHSIVKDIVVFSWMELETTADSLAKTLRERGFESSRIGLELSKTENFASGAYDAGSYLRLTELLPNATVVDVSDLVLELRLRKSPLELEHMRKAGEITWATLSAAIEATAEGVNENEIIGAAYAGGTAAGSELMSIDPMLMSGPRTGLMPHLPYRRHVVEAGDVVYMEFTGTYWRYNAPSMRSTVIGEPSARVQQLADTSIEVLQGLQESIRPGRTGHDIAMDVRGLWEQTPNVFFHGGYGYSIGMGFQPTWTENPVYIAEGADRELEPWMTFHLPINPFYPGEVGLGFSESIVVTEEGCERLTPGKGLELVSR